MEVNSKHTQEGHKAIYTGLVSLDLRPHSHNMRKFSTLTQHTHTHTHFENNNNIHTHTRVGEHPRMLKALFNTIHTLSPI